MRTANCNVSISSFSIINNKTKNIIIDASLTRIRKDNLHVTFHLLVDNLFVP